MNLFTAPISGSVDLSILELRHAPLFFGLVRANHSRLAEWCPWLEEVETIDKTENFIQSKLTKFARGDGFTAGLFDQRELLGVIALEYIDRANSVTEIGYWLGEHAVGHGLVTTACRRLIDHVFSDLEIERVQIRCASDNLRSRTIPERLGFKQEGVIRQCERLADRTVDLVTYGMLKDEWGSKN